MIYVLLLGRMAVVATVVVANLATPNGAPWTRVAVGTTPDKNVAVSGLDEGELVPAQRVYHVDYLRAVAF